MLSKILYQTSATANGGRDGRARTDDGSLNVWLDLPVELGGRGHGNNPEQLFAAGYAACFLSAMKTVASSVNVKVPSDASTTATVGIGPRTEGGFGLSVQINVQLPGVNREDGQRLIEAAHAACPYSNAIRGNIDVALTLA